MEVIFEYFDHFSYLRDRLTGANKWGSKTKFSEFIGVQPAFVSQVLSEKYTLSPEQADLANQYFDHSTDEAEFFILLVLKDRAGSTSLKKIFQLQIANTLNKRKSVIARLGQKPSISEEAQAIYYSSWLYPTLHVACTIPELRSRRALSERFSLPLELVGKILDFLESNFLVEKNRDEYIPTQNWVRLGKESPHIIKHHTNWRNQAIQNLELQTDEDLHYSGVFSMDKNTSRIVKDALLDNIKAQTKKIESAKEEEIYIIGLDFFRKK